jgi:ribosomal protein L37E
VPLITCPDCGSSASDQAEVCPSCGFPLSAGGPVRTRSNQTQLIEFTGKRYKAMLALGWLIFLTGLLILAASLTRSDAARLIRTIGLWMTGAGFAWLALTRIVIWWKHG